MAIRINDKTRQLTIEICGALLILLFLYTAVSKWLDFTKFTNSINNQPFDNSLTPLFIWGIPLSEVLVSLLLVIPSTRRWGFYLSLLMMLVFTGYIGLVLLNYFQRRPCGCGGAIEALDWEQHFIFNLFFTAVAALGAVLISRRKSWPPAQHVQAVNT